MLIYYGMVSLVGSNQVNLNGLTERLDTIIDYGVGYSDVVEVIAIPLIIAILAFSMPFIFTAINHINNKYASNDLSKLLERSSPYMLLRFFFGASIAYLLILGVVTLLPIRTLLVDVISWSALSFSIASAFSVLWFIYFCIKYNKAEGVIRIICKRHQIERRRAWIKICRRKLKSKWINV